MKTILSTLLLLSLALGAARGSEPMIERGHSAPCDSVLIAFRMKVSTPERMPEDARGIGLVVFDEAMTPFDAGTPMDEPNHEHAISIAFDVHNPQPTDLEPDENGRVMGWFDSMGNWYDRPQREISVHANNRERLNTRSPIEYRTGEWIDVLVQIDYILGGAHISVRLDETTVIDHKIWDVRPMAPSAYLDVLGSGLVVEDLTILRADKIDEPMPEAVRVSVFDKELLQNAAWLKSTIDFSQIPEQTGRVIATLTLDEPEMGYDHWDKKGTIGIKVPSDNTETDFPVTEPERFEVFRFITPYRRGWSWHMDVTDLLPLFEDEREFDAHIGTYMKGWLVSFTLDFYPGAPERTPIKVVNLWTGDAEIGNPENPTSAFYKSIATGVPQGTTSARVRMTVTGHGMHPNSKNAGEFMPIWRTLTIRTDESTGDVLGGDFIEQSERNHLWKTDVYLNPCRPQGGTWKFDRSGWAPGDKVAPWCVDTQSEFVFGDTLIVEYTLDEYLNEGRGETWAPHHWTDAQLVFYK